MVAPFAVSILTMSVDYLENLNTLEMLKSFPDLTETMVNKGSFFIEIKNLSVLIIKILFALLGIAFLVKMIKGFVLKKESNL